MPKPMTTKQLEALSKGRAIRAQNLRLKKRSINQLGGNEQLLNGISTAISNLVKLNIAPGRIHQDVQPRIFFAMKKVHSGDLRGAYGILSNALMEFGGSY